MTTAPPSSRLIPRLEPRAVVDPVTASLLDALRNGGFDGGIATDLATRIVHASDNSIYEETPQAVVRPRHAGDVVLLLRLMAEPRFRAIRLAPRGGGTGTDGSSLTNGIVLDLARSMNRILEIDLDARRARVEPGVVLGRLNAELRPLGFQFGPTVSPHDRATLGGMIGTDAAGKGSRIHGKTGDHVRSLRVVVPGGAIIDCRRRPAAEVDSLIAAGGAAGQIHRAVREALSAPGIPAELAARWPTLERPLAGYTLPKAFDPATGELDLAALVTGAEGTLGVVVEAELSIVPLPKARRTVFVGHASFDEAVAAAEPFGATKPAAIETMDETVLSLARQDPLWSEIGAALGSPEELASLGAVNLVEYEGDDAAEVDRRAASLVAGRPAGAAVARRIEDEAVRRAIWTLRERAVGLLGNMPGERRPVAFVEDCAVPPARLPEFVRRFRAILDRHRLSYGMYGHVDAGCLHVRPALDLRDPADERLVREITDEVAAMTHELGGVLWGEHGKGYRSRFSEAFFGPVLFRAMGRIKKAFDPWNQLNPGKIAVPEGEATTQLSIEASTRGSRDRAIEPSLGRRHAAAIHCNGNAACQSWDPTVAMCPSVKITQDPRHSPRGRAILMREWMRRVSAAGWRDEGDRTGTSIASAPRRLARRWLDRLRGDPSGDFSHEVRAAMDGCLSCKACAGGCPVRVSVPEFRAEFLHQYHRRYGRPLRDRLIGGLEEALPRLSRHASLVNAVSERRLVRWLTEHVVGLADAPRLATPALEARLAARGTAIESIDSIASLPPAGGQAEVILLQDAFTSFLDPDAALGAVRLLEAFGVRPRVAEYFPSGKGWHVKGFLDRFERIARANLDRLARLARSGRLIVGVDPATTLVMRDELPKALGIGAEKVPPVLLLWEYLDQRPLDRRASASPATARLLGHCTERALEPGSAAAWRRIFARAGIDLAVESVGCCGMGGSWGHERTNAADSRGIFGLSWAARMPEHEAEWSRVVVSGFSCRSQIERICGRRAASPAEHLAEALASSRDR